MGQSENANTIIITMFTRGTNTKSTNHAE